MIILATTRKTLSVLFCLEDLPQYQSYGRVRKGKRGDEPYVGFKPAPFNRILCLRHPALWWLLLVLFPFFFGLQGAHITPVYYLKPNPIQPGSGSGSPRKRSITIDDRDRPEIGAPMDFSHLKHMRADEAKLTMYETHPHRHIVNSTVEGVGGMCDAFHRPTRRGGLQLMLAALRSFDNVVQNSS